MTRALPASRPWRPGQPWCEDGPVRYREFRGVRYRAFVPRRRRPARGGGHYAGAPIADRAEWRRLCGEGL